jgi:hypothetical protein
LDAIKSSTFLCLPAVVVAEFQNHIKETLSLELAREMIKRKLIEFTVSHDASHINTIYRARCCVMPDEQVKIVRTIIDKR